MLFRSIKDRMTQAKTYHGLIADGQLQPSLENEVFTLLYYVTDNTMLRLERAVLLCNCQLTSAELGSLYNSTKGSIDNVPITINMNAFPVYGVEVDKAAKSLLEEITGVTANFNPSSKQIEYARMSETERNNGIIIGKSDGDGMGYTNRGAELDSNDYMYGILRPGTDGGAEKRAGTGVSNEVLADAIKKTNASAVYSS